MFPSTRKYIFWRPQADFHKLQGTGAELPQAGGLRGGAQRLQLHGGPGSVADPGSGAFLTLDPDPGSGIGFFRIPDRGSRIPTPYFLEHSDKFLGKKLCNSLKAGPDFFLQHLKNKIIFNFVKFVATKKGLTTNFFFHPSLLLLFSDPGSESRDPGSGIRNG